MSRSVATARHQCRAQRNEGETRDARGQGGLAILGLLVGTAAFSYLRDVTNTDEERFFRNQRDAAEKYRERRPEPRMTATRAETPHFEFVRFERLLRLPFPDWTEEDRAYAKSLAAAKLSAESNWPPAWRNLSWKLSAK